MARPTCGTCEFYKSEGPVPRRGQCHYNPPTTVVVVDRNQDDNRGVLKTKPIAVFPFVNADTDWCGAHEPKS